MEIELRQHLRRGSSALNISDIIEEIKKNDDVSFYWEIIASNWESEEAEELHNLLSRHWITLRGFSHAGAFLENYKRSSSKCTQKSKGIRKTLIGKSGDE